MKLAFVCVLIGGALFFSGRYGMNRMPIAENLTNRLAKEPIQVPIQSGVQTGDPAPIRLTFRDKNYELIPRAEYSLEGLIVSQHRSDSAFDLMHKRTGDFLNIQDICTVWGRTLSSGLYRDIKFWSGDWTCNFQASAENFAAIKFDEIANNHILAKDETIRKTLEGLEKGDEIRIRGKLVDYQIEGLGLRKTSLVRNDTGNGACEILYVEAVEVLKSHQRAWRHVRDAGYWLALAAITWIVGLMGYTVFLKRA
ncbi:MAG: hypothetical protein RBT63_06160 [Bdellovibrionales bacterium]|jgi:hypothetical protein|nr:hypothetical protein [Bdellovibrionales bacterium]